VKPKHKKTRMTEHSSSVRFYTSNAQFTYKTTLLSRMEGIIVGEAGGRRFDYYQADDNSVCVED